MKETSSTFFVDAEEVAKEILEVARESVSEEDLKQGVEYLLRSKVIERLKEVEKTEIPYASWRPPRARYEVTLVSGLRADALYGHLIIEYERPKTFDSRSGFENAVEQAKSYIVAHAEVEARFPRYFGVVLDGYRIGVVRYREAIKGFESKGPFEVNKNTVAKLIEAIIGLRRNSQLAMNDAYLGSKPLIPEDVIAFISVGSEDEAHYICSILNSSLVNLVLQSIAKGGKNFATPEFINMINIGRFDSSNFLHKKLAELSKKAHQLAQRSQEDELKKVEKEIDKTVAQLYGISEGELKEIGRCLAMLEGEEIEGEVEEAAELPLSMPDITLRNNVVGEGRPFNVDVVVSNPLDKPLTNVSVKLKLFDGRLIEKSFEGVEGEVSFPISFDGLKAGEYKIEAVFNYVFENTPKRVEKNLTIYVKGGEVKHVERSFRPEELLGV